MPNQDNFEKSWRITKNHLESASKFLPAKLLPGKEGATHKSIEEFISHNELELALDDLADVGYANHPPLDFWRALVLAAKNMELDDRLPAFQGTGQLG